MDKSAAILLRVHRATLNGNLLWGETASEGIYQTSFPAYTLEIAEETSTYPRVSNLEPTEHTDHVLRIYNKDGKLVDEIRDWDSNLDDLQDPFELMGEIYKTARRQAMGVNEAYDYILGQLPPDEDLPF